MYLSSSNNSVISSPGSECSNNLTPQNSSIENVLDTFIEKLQEKIGEIDEKQTTEQTNMDEFIIDFKAIINQQHHGVIKEIHEFYDKKAKVLRKALSDTKKLQYLQESATCNIIKKHMKKMIDEFMYSTKLTFKKCTVFEKSVLTKEKEFGTLIKPVYEKPIKETCFTLDDDPIKIIHTKIGFLVLLNDFCIVKLHNNQCLIQEDEVILDICSTMEDNLAYLQYLDNQYCVKLRYFDSEEVKEIWLPEVDIGNEVFFAVYKNYVLIGSYDSYTTYRIEISTSKITSIKSKAIQCHKVFPDGWVFTSYSRAGFFDFKEFRYLIYPKEEINKDDFSIYDDLVRKINNGIKIFSYDNEIYSVDLENNRVTAIEEIKIFESMELKHYVVTKDEVIFCLSRYDSNNQIVLQYYPNIIGRI